MNWRYKALLQAALSSLPAGHKVNSALSRYVTKTLPSAEHTLMSNYSFALQHAAAFRAFGSVPLGDAFFYEFGAGWDLMNALSLYSCGVNRQLVTDIRRLLRSGFINHALGAFRALRLQPAPIRLPAPLPRPLPNRIDSLLRETYGIDYRAPFDPENTGLEDCSVDYITATKVLSYLGPDHLREVVNECRRILRPGGVMSVIIDYRDNYAYFDKSISVYNFLRHSDEEWSRRLFNPPLFFQNRLRHCDYAVLFNTAGLEIIEARHSDGGSTRAAREALASVPLSDRFKRYHSDDLLPVRGSFVLGRVAH